MGKKTIFPAACVDCGGEVTEEWYQAKKTHAGLRCEECGPKFWRARNAAWRKDNREWSRQQSATRRAAHPDPNEAARRSRLKLRLEVLSAYGPENRVECAECGESDEVVLDLDHIDGNGGEHRKEFFGSRTGDPAKMMAKLRQEFKKTGIWPTDPKLQILCANCHTRKDRAAMRGSTKLTLEWVRANCGQELEHKPHGYQPEGGGWLWCWGAGEEGAFGSCIRCLSNRLGVVPIKCSECKNDPNHRVSGEYCSEHAHLSASSNYHTCGSENPS